MLAVMQWWFQDNFDSWESKQDTVLVPLSEIFFLSKEDRRKFITQSHYLRDCLLKTWDNWRGLLCSSPFPLMSFIYHPGFSRVLLFKDGNHVGSIAYTRFGGLQGSCLNNWLFLNWVVLRNLISNMSRFVISSLRALGSGEPSDPLHLLSFC